jgi:hypothetical protein
MASTQFLAKITKITSSWCTDVNNVVHGVFGGVKTAAEATAKLVAATENNKGVVELASDAEANAGTDATRAITPLNLANWTGNSALLKVGALISGSITAAFGSINIGTSTLDCGRLTVDSDTINVTTQKTPASASDTGTKGDIVHDGDFVYVCVATDTWKRAAIATW